MPYFLKQSNTRSKGLYLQIYHSFYVPGKGSRNKSYKAIGYVSELIKNGIDDPIAYAKKIVDELNNTSSTPIKISSSSSSKNVGCLIN